MAPACLAIYEVTVWKVIEIPYCSHWWIPGIAALQSAMTVGRRTATGRIVKGCRTSARARGNAAIDAGLRAGVGQASREETAAHAAVVVEGYGAMGIGAARPWCTRLATDVCRAVEARQCGRAGSTLRQGGQVPC